MDTEISQPQAPKNQYQTRPRPRPRPVPNSRKARGLNKSNNNKNTGTINNKDAWESFCHQAFFTSSAPNTSTGSSLSTPPGEENLLSEQELKRKLQLGFETESGFIARVGIQERYGAGKRDCISELRRERGKGTIGRAAMQMSGYNVGTEKNQMRKERASIVSVISRRMSLGTMVSDRGGTMSREGMGSIRDDGYSAHGKRHESQVRARTFNVHGITDGGGDLLGMRHQSRRNKTWAMGDDREKSKSAGLNTGMINADGNRGGKGKGKADDTSMTGEKTVVLRNIPTVKGGVWNALTMRMPKILFVKRFEIEEDEHEAATSASVSAKLRNKSS